MAQAKLNHSSNCSPIMVPTNLTGDPYFLQRIQGIDSSISLSDEKIYQVGKVDHLGFKKLSPKFTSTLRQLEYGNIDIFKKMANTTNDKVLFTDFYDNSFDLYYYLQDDNDNYIGTMWYPNARLSGFSINAGDPEATVERSFSLVGENPINLSGKYLYTQSAVATVDGTFDFLPITTPPYIPLEDSDISGEYLLAVYLNGTLLKTSEYSFSGSGAITVPSAVAGDFARWYYARNSFPSGEVMYESDDSSNASITADSISIELTDGEYLYRIQNMGLDISFDRTDFGEIGNRNKILNGASNTDIRVTLGRKFENFSIERILRGVDGTHFKLDPYNMLNTHDLTVKVYSDYKKDTFLCGYRFENLGVIGMDSSIPMRDYIDQNTTLSGSTGFITNQISDLA